ncbi:DUF4271 domain-containing protein [Parabacteroides sp. OttesenSCG-928-N08]|nr:DUF4271 domain-containing protein [Parabacteroides sp. OttesenSCG-928-N08]
MDAFEGYVGIRAWEEQWVDDIIFSLLLFLFIAFALVFRSNYRVFLKMLKDLVHEKKRLNLFENAVGNEKNFRLFMGFQTLFLCAIGLFSFARIEAYIKPTSVIGVLGTIAGLFLLLSLFFLFKQFINILIGKVFATEEEREVWLTGYYSILGVWGILIYIPTILLALNSGLHHAAVILFLFLFLLSRLAIIYKTIRIFSIKSDGLFYLFLYLCAQEFMPLLIAYKGIFYIV